MIKLLKKGLFLTPFILFFFAAERYSEENITTEASKPEVKGSIETEQSVETKPGERLQIIVKTHKQLSTFEKKQPVVLLSHGENKDNIEESHATRSLAAQILVCYPSGVSSEIYSYECFVPDHWERVLSYNEFQQTSPGSN